VSARLRRAAAALWSGLRAFCGDSAYETYASRARGPLLDRKAFWLDSLERRYRGPSRCC
jgi:hypothetical protein